MQGHMQAFIDNCAWLLVRVMVRIQFRVRHSKAATGGVFDWFPLVILVWGCVYCSVWSFFNGFGVQLFQTKVGKVGGGVTGC